MQHTTLPFKTTYRTGKKFFYISQVLISLLSFISTAYAQTTYTFSYSGSMQSFVVPSTGSIQIESWGAQGGANWVNNTNFGGYAKAVYNFTAGTVLNIYVGQQPTTTTGGYNGGGGGEGAGIGGGGASDVRLNGTALSDRVLVAGGGGGAGYWSSLHVVGGVGGGLTGGDGYRNSTADPGGKGGTQTGSGNGTCVSFNNPAMAGGLGYGGTSSGCGCEGYGGGGGYYGGGGSGNCRGGGGGSGYIAPSALNGTLTSGLRAGHGQVIITILFSATTTQSNVSCNGGSNGSATVTASGVAGPYTYSWIPSGSTSSVASGLAAGSYTCVIGSPGVTIEPVVILTQPPALTVSIVSQSNLTCNGGSNGAATLGVGGGISPYTYTWTPAGGNAVTASGLTAGNYTAMVKDANNCTTIQPLVLTQPSAFSISANTTASAICIGASITLNGIGANTYTWTGNVIDASAFSPTITTTYSLTASNASGCPASNMAVITITVNNLPVIAVNSGSICAGNAFTITASGAGTYTYTGGNSIVSPAGNTSYSVTGTSTAGCISASPAISGVTVVALPIVSVNSGSVCSGQSFTLTPSGASTYTYSSGNAIVSPTITTSYSITGTSSVGCVSSNPAISSVTVEALPVISVNSGSICNGESFTISPSGAVSYIFSSGTSVVSPSTNTSYSVTGTNSAGCASETISTVTVNIVPTITVNSGMICAGQSFTLIASGADTYTYTSGSAIVSPTSSASYSVTGTSPEGCVSSNTAVASLTVNALPVLTISGSTAICSGSTTTLMVNGANTYSWSTTDITSTVSVSPVSTSVYTVTGVDTNGCENTAFHSLTVNPLPVITPINSNSLICTGESSSIFVNGPDTYSWSSGVTGTIIVIAPLNTSSYTVTATTASGCTNSAIATQSVSECTGFASIRAANVAVSVYPNPNNGEFTISSNMEGILSLRNELGQSISIIKLNAGKYHLAVLSNVPNGIYFLSGRVGNEAIHQKIIISK